VIGANVCRISGKLPAGGCDHVEVVNRDGFVETRSMIYTEYFVKGTQPTEECPLHGDRGFLDALAGVFGRETGPPPMPVDATGLPVPAPPAQPAGTAGAPAPPAPAEAEAGEPAKRRGFWSRIFGGRDRKAEEKRKEDPKKKSGG
jgi:hypothetical protein